MKRRRRACAALVAACLSFVSSACTDTGGDATRGGGGEGGSSGPAIGPRPDCPVEAAPGTPGVTDTELWIGLPRIENIEAEWFPGLPPPKANLDDYGQALIDQINAEGGLACRTVKVVWHDVSLDHYGFPRLEEEMCTTWTQDRPVLAAMPTSDTVGDILYTCLERNGAVGLDVFGTFIRDRKGLADLRRLLVLNAPELTRATVAQVEAHVRRRFLTKSTRTGVVYYDDALTRRLLDEAVVPTLTAHGLEVAERQGVTVPDDDATQAARDQDLASAVLRFKAAEVDRVLLLRGDGLAATFMKAAEAQAYRPRYGLSTIELSAAHGDEGAPPEQLRGAEGIGWLPESDLAPRQPDSWPARQRCLSFLTERGFVLEALQDRQFALVLCDVVWLVRAAVQAAQRPLSGDSFLAGALRLGDSYESPLTRWTRFGPGRRDGAYRYFDATYDEKCRCWAYMGPPRELAG